MRKSVYGILCLMLLSLPGCVQYAGAEADDDGKEIQVVINPERDEDGKLVPVEKTPEEWAAELTEKEYGILREQQTERAFTGRYHDSKDDGVYACAGCGLALYDSETKFDSGTGWPSFYQAIVDDHVGEVEDNSYGMRRVEIVCARCHGHLGHVFPDGPRPTGMRHCVNGYSLRFVDRDKFEQLQAEADGQVRSE